MSELDDPAPGTLRPVPRHVPGGRSARTSLVLGLLSWLLAGFLRFGPADPPPGEVPLVDHLPLLVGVGAVALGVGALRAHRAPSHGLAQAGIALGGLLVFLSVVGRAAGR